MTSRDVEDAIVRERPVRLPGEGSPADELAFTLRVTGVPAPVREHHFMWCCEHPKREHPSSELGCGGCVAAGSDDWKHTYRRRRDWRFDFAWPAVKLAVEFEGGAYVGGRHVRGQGFEGDIEKYNAAVLDGWRVLRFTTAMVEDGRALETIEAAL